MEKEVSLLVWGAIAGLMSAVALELAKNWLERSRAAYQEAEEWKRKSSEQLGEFLRGGSSLILPGQPPDPAWLRQVSVARRYPLARLGLRNDEDYGTDAHRVSHPSPGFSVTLLKTFRRGHTRARRPSRQKGGKFLLGPAHIIGRGSKCDIQVLDPSVSLLHAFIRFEGEQYVLYDLGSTSGTIVNEEQVGVMGVPLAGGEIIQMGNTTFEFGRVIKGGEADPADPFLII